MTRTGHERRHHKMQALRGACARLGALHERTLRPLPSNALHPGRADLARASRHTGEEIIMSTDADRMAADLAKIKAETALIEAQNAKARAETDKQLQVIIDQSIAETARLQAETRKIDREAVVAIAGTVAATLGLLKLAGLLK